MKPLDVEDFRAFFAAVHSGREAFPWQLRLAQRLLAPPPGDARNTDATPGAPPGAAGSPWPQPIALPTGTGKTTCLDLAVFHLAAQAGLPPASRTAARRIFYVVDRRIIVDEAFDQARRLARLLAEAREGIVREVADRLRLTAGEDAEEPLAATQLRGGVYRNHAWARTPTQPTIICTTVDQLGSRLLFRGYGVSAAARPIHAALAAHDTLILLDEAHLSGPFLQTLEAICDYRRLGQPPATGPFEVVVLSATPRDASPAGETAFGLEPPDRANPVLGPRLAAPKITTLHVATKAKGPGFVVPLARELARQALALANSATGQPGIAVAVFANRVATARATKSCLVAELGDRADVLLLTGRMRPHDRDFLSESWLPRLRPTDQPRLFPKPVFVVATQTLEVGANLDFDALVTECASLDALRQRFGRLNRGGRPGESRAAIVIRADQSEPAGSEAEADPVYGNAISRTWRWLRERCGGATIDFGIDALQPHLDGLDATEQAALCSPVVHAPAVLPAHLDCWVQTSPEPCPSPDLDPFLHGQARETADVLVCWRADLSGTDTDSWIETLALCPPAAAECLPVPLSRLRSWMLGTTPGDDLGSDAPSREDAPDSAAASAPQGYPLLRWRGPDASEAVVHPAGIRPGDLLVIPREGAAARDGLGDFPDGAPVDVGDAVQILSRTRPVLRLRPELVEQWPAGVDRTAVKALLESLPVGDLAEQLAEDSLRRDLAAALRLVSASHGSPADARWLRNSADWLARELGSRGRARKVLHLHPAGGLILRSARRLGRNVPSGLLPGAGESFDQFSSEDDTASASVPVGLEAHSRAVARRARAYARDCGLEADLQEALEVAGWLHDLGKADPRFQALLNPGGRAGGTLLAKSGSLPLGEGLRRDLAHRSGYPKGARHELLSLRLAELLIADGEGLHRDLILHLIGASHGHCRPLAPVVSDPAPIAVRLRWPRRPEDSASDGAWLEHSSATGLEHLDAGVTDRFWRLVRRLGWWGLALCEAILLLSDHRTSEAEQNQADPEPTP
jgi:CRISPR-associated endonuclease/helicase Cas3